MLALDEVALDLWRPVQLQQAVVLEVALNQSTRLEGHLELRGAERVYHAALHLVHGATEAQDRTHVDGGMHR